MKEGNLKVQKMGRGFAWFDTGTHEALAEATEFVKTIEKRTDLKIGCLEEIAIHQQWIEKEIVLNNIKDYKGDYFKYLQKLD